jgi:hypothetical protein
MKELKEELVVLLKELWSAHGAFNSNSRGFDEQEFLAMTARGQMEYLELVDGSFFGRDGLDRALVEKQFLRKTFLDDFWPVYKAYKQKLEEELR